MVFMGNLGYAISPGPGKQTGKSGKEVTKSLENMNID